MNNGARAAPFCLGNPVAEWLSHHFPAKVRQYAVK
jgi:hypothetical protein